MHMPRCSLRVWNGNKIASLLNVIFLALPIPTGIAETRTERRKGVSVLRMTGIEDLVVGNAVHQVCCRLL